MVEIHQRPAARINRVAWLVFISFNVEGIKYLFFETDVYSSCPAVCCGFTVFQTGPDRKVVLVGSGYVPVQFHITNLYESFTFY